jgi:hypothetical protein
MDKLDIHGCIKAVRGFARGLGWKVNEGDFKPKDDPVVPPPEIPITPPVTPPVIEEENMQYTRLFGAWKIFKLFGKIPIPYKEVRLKGWISQLRKSKALSGASADAFVVGLLLCWPLWQGVKLAFTLIIKLIVKIF